MNQEPRPSILDSIFLVFVVMIIILIFPLYLVEWSYRQLGLIAD